MYRLLCFSIFGLKQNYNYLYTLIKTNKMEDVQLKGIALNRMVFLNGEQLKPSIGSRFDWGYVGQGSTELGEAIVEYLGLADENNIEDVIDKGTEICQTFIATLPQGNFDAILKISKWLDWSNTKSALKRSVFALTDIIINDQLTISKFLDFPHNGIRTAIIKKGTIEYDLLNTIYAEGKLDKLNAYYKAVTSRPNHENMKETIFAEITKSVMENEFVFVGGLGNRAVFEGHKKSEYEQ